MTMGSDITAHRMSIGMFYARAYSSLLKRYSIFFRFGINVKIKCEKTFYNKDNVVEKAT
jgi:hypothetical protein